MSVKKAKLTIAAIIAWNLAPAGSASAAWSEGTLYEFCAKTNCTDGYLPTIGLVRDSAGNLYGVTAAGGKDQVRVPFELALQGGAYKYSVLHQFGVSDGLLFPSGELILDKDGDLYGVAYEGGANDVPLRTAPMASSRLRA
ncbi:MAG TPA: choice-of-anchor tandem repeat GloVer-containing protein [Rhizomicrobium sp.]|jgi:hypothetical protein